MALSLSELQVFLKRVVHKITIPTLESPRRPIMSQSQPKPLPDTIRRAIAQAVVNPTQPINLVVKAHCNKQMTLTLVEGPFKYTLLRLHKKLHRTFYQVVAAAKRLLANLMAALTDPLSITPVALIPATCTPAPA